MSAPYSVQTASVVASVVPAGKLRYANNSNYKNDVMIRKEVSLHFLYFSLWRWGQVKYCMMLLGWFLGGLLLWVDGFQLHVCVAFPAAERGPVCTFLWPGCVFCFTALFSEHEFKASPKCEWLDVLFRSGLRPQKCDGRAEENHWWQWDHQGRWCPVASSRQSWQTGEFVGAAGGRLQETTRADGENVLPICCLIQPGGNTTCNCCCSHFRCVFRQGKTSNPPP